MTVPISHTIAMLGAGLAFILGWVAIVFAAFRTSRRWGWLCLFVPGCPIIFIAVNWRKTWLPFCVMAGGALALSFALLASASEVKRRLECAGNMRVLAMAVSLYQDDNGSFLPDSGVPLFPYVEDAATYRSPLARANYRYVYRPGLREGLVQRPEDNVVLFAPLGGDLDPGRNVLFHDGRVVFMREETFRPVLAETRRALFLPPKGDITSELLPPDGFSAPPVSNPTPALVMIGTGVCLAVCLLALFGTLRLLHAQGEAAQSPEQISSNRVAFQCPHCKSDVEAPTELVGQRASCPVCGHDIGVPIPDALVADRRGGAPPRRWRVILSLALVACCTVALACLLVSIRRRQHSGKVPQELIEETGIPAAEPAADAPLQFRVTSFRLIDRYPDDLQEKLRFGLGEEHPISPGPPNGKLAVVGFRAAVKRPPTAGESTMIWGREGSAIRVGQIAADGPEDRPSCAFARTGLFLGKWQREADTEFTQCSRLIATEDGHIATRSFAMTDGWPPMMGEPTNETVALGASDGDADFFGVFQFVPDRRLLVFAVISSNVSMRFPLHSFLLQIGEDWTLTGHRSIGPLSGGEVIALKALHAEDH